MRSRYPEFPGEQLLRMVTLAGRERSAGPMNAGAWKWGSRRIWSRCRCRSREAADPHELLLGDHAGQRRTMFRGEWRNAEPQVKEPRSVEPHLQALRMCGGASGRKREPPSQPPRIASMTIPPQTAVKDGADIKGISSSESRVSQ